MNGSPSAQLSCETSSCPSWPLLANRVLQGHGLTTQEGLAVLQSSDDELLDLLAAVFRVRRHYFGKTVQLYFLINAKSGLCPEDCGYCSQSAVSTAEIPQYNLLSRQHLLDGAQQAVDCGAATYCIVISARGPNEREMQAITSIVVEIKQKHDLKICASLGLLSPSQARRLKDCGVDRINHNLNSSQDFYRKICTTHTYQDRLGTLQAARQAGLEMCSGGIIGMGEEDVELVKMAIELRELHVQSIPINFLIPVKGTPLADAGKLNARYCLKALAMFRLANPDREIRIAGGRELHLGSMQAMGLYAANSMFVGDYLTTKGQVPQADYKMIEELGFVVTSAETVS